MYGHVSLSQRILLFRITRKQVWKKVRQKIGNIPHLSIDWDVLTDRFIEPVIWVVDHFADSLGKVITKYMYIF